MRQEKVVVQSNLQLSQLGKCFAIMARRSDAFEEVRGWHPYGKHPVRYHRSRPGKGVYVLNVPEYGSMQCTPRNPPVLGPGMRQGDDALLRAAIATVQAMVNLGSLRWPSGRTDARLRFEIQDWPPNPLEQEEDRKRKREAMLRSQVQATVDQEEEVEQPDDEPQGPRVVGGPEVEELTSTDAAWLGEDSAAAENPAQETFSGEELGWGPIIMNIDLVEGNYEVRDGQFWPLTG